MPRQCFNDNLNSGKPLAGGLIYSCGAGTSCPGNPLATFTDSTGTRQNFNPVTLDSAGCASIWLSTGLAYKFVAQNASGVQEWSADNVTGLASTLTNSIASTTAIAFSSTPTFTSLAQNQLFTMTLTGNVTSSNLVMSGVTPPGLVSFEITQDGTGGRTFVWPVNSTGGMWVDLSPNHTTSQAFYWDGSTLIAINGNFWNYTSPSGLHAYSLFRQNITSPTSSDLTGYFVNTVTGTLPSNQALDAISGETDLVGIINNSPTGLVIHGNENAVGVLSTGGTIPLVQAAVGYMNTSLGSTTNVTTAEGLDGLGCNSILGTGTIQKCYGVVGENQVNGASENYSMVGLGDWKGINGHAFDVTDNGGTPRHTIQWRTDNNIQYFPLVDGAAGWRWSRQDAGADYLLINATDNVKVPSRMFSALGGLTVGTGVAADGSGFKHKRFGATCSTAATTGTTCTTTFSWTTAFADANYTPVCTPVGPTQVGIFSLASFNAAGVTIEVVAGTNASASFSGVDCIATHD